MTKPKGLLGFRCPFCGGPLTPPDVVKMDFIETEGGRCECGAVYVCDRTGRMLGEAFSDALVIAFGGDYDTAFSAPEEGYEEITMTYSARHRKFVPHLGSRPKKESMYVFVKRKKKI